MSLFDNMTPPAKARSCKVATVAAELSESDGKKLLQMVMDEAWAIKTLARELNKRGVLVSETPISNHRNKACKCWKI